MLCKIPSTTILGILIIGFCLAVFFSFEKLSFAVPNSNLQVVPRENPQGGGFFFHFSDEASSKKNPTPPDVFSIFSKYFSKTKFWGWVFFSFEKHQFFEDSSKKTPPLGVFPRNHCTRFPICRFFSDSEIYPFFITNNEKSENDV